MKKIILLSLGLFCILSSQGQINKGTILLGANINGGNSKNEWGSANFNYNKGNSVTLSAGKAIRQNIVMGLSGYYSRQKLNKTTEGNYQRYIRYGSSIFIRRYFPLAKKFYFIGEGTLNFNKSEYLYHSITSFDSHGNQNNIGISFSPSLAYGLTKNIQLEVGLGSLASLYYIWEKYYPSEFIIEKSNGINVSASANTLAEFNVGFRFYL